MDVGDFCLGVAVGAFGLLVLRMALWCRAMLQAEEQLLSASDKLMRWHEARPHLKVAACPYSRTLVHEMLQAYSRLLELGAVTDTELYQKLQALLDDDPSPYSPQTYNPATSGVSFLRVRIS